MAYLAPGAGHADIADLKLAIQSLDSVDKSRFIPKQEALSQLKAQMKYQSSLFENLTENPLPDSFEIRMTAATESWQKIEVLAAQIKRL